MGSRTVGGGTAGLSLIVGLLLPVLIHSSPSLAIEPTEKGFTRIRGPIELTQNDVTSIAQDRIGFLWFGTQDGLIRYDGYEFVIYRHDRNDANSLAASFIRALHKDSNGRLWVGTDLGINLYNETSDEFSRFPLDTGGTIYDVEEDGLGNIWLGTSTGLYRFDELERVFLRSDELDALNAGQPVWALARGDDGVLLAGTANGLWGISRDEHASISYESFDVGTDDSSAKQDVRALEIDSEGRVWIGIFQGGLIRLDKKANVSRPMDHIVPRGNRISRIFEDSEGLLWIGTIEDGLLTYDRESGDVERLRHQPSDTRSLSHDRVRSIVEDKSGLIWIGAGPGGINRYDRRSEKLAHFRFRTDDPRSLSHNEVSTIHVGPSGGVWVGTFDGGLNLFDGVDSFQRIQHDPGDDSSLSSNRVFAVLVDSSGELWVGTGENGLNRYDSATRRFEHYLNDPDDPDSISHNRVRVLFEDSRGQLWVGTAGGGLDLFDRQNERFIHYRHDSSDANSLAENTVRFILEDHNNKLWIGTASAGLSRLDNDTGRFKRFTHVPANPGSLTHNRVQAMYEGPDHRLWIGTPAGLTQIDHNGRVLASYSREDGLANDIVYCIVGDKEGGLLVSTNSGISRFLPATETFENFDVGDGLQSNEFFAGSCAVGDDGTAMFGGVNGLTIFDPEELSKRDYQPAVVLTEFQLHNQTVYPSQLDADSPLQSRILLSESISLDHDENDIAFRFAALDFASPDRIRYEYQLVGYDPGWIGVEALNRLARYSALPAGKYEFVVRASSSSGIWGTKVRQLQVSVSPPPWKSAWAFGVYAVAAMLIGMLILYFNRRRTKYLENLVNERTLELRDQTTLAEKAVQARSIFLAKMSHEIRTPINAVMSMLQLLKSPALSREQEEYIQTIHESTAALLTIVDQILLFSRVEHESADIEHLEFHPHHLISGLTQLMRAVADKKKLDIESRISENVPNQLVGDPEKIRQICINLISNAIKFSENGKVTISVDYVSDAARPGFLLISVIDTGIGMTPEECERAFNAYAQVDSSHGRNHGGTGLGLAITKELVTAMGGEITVMSKPGQGSVFTVRLPDSNSVPQQLPSNTSSTYPKIMLVEDIEANLRVIEEALKAEGHIVRAFRDGHAAIDAYSRFRPDLVILDINMPRISGTDVALKIRNATNSLSGFSPIVALTATTTEGLAGEYLESGINAVLHKPFSYQRLSAVLARIHDAHFRADWLLKHIEQLGVYSAMNLLREARVSLLAECRTFAKADSGNDESTAAESIHRIRGIAESFAFEQLARSAKALDDSFDEGTARASAVEVLWVAGMTIHCLDLALLQERHPGVEC